MVNFKQIKAFVFDAYGTLFNIGALDDRLAHHFGENAAEIGTIWRQKQLEYTWLRTLMAKYQPFSNVTEDALGYACEKLGVKLNPEVVIDLMFRYHALSSFPEVKKVLDELRKKHHLAILSNAEHKMLQSAVVHNKLENVFNRVISVDVISQFKPSPKVYQLAISGLEVEKEYIAFVSTNTWDVAGAKSFGFKTIWLNRAKGTREHLGFEPDMIINGLDDLLTNNLVDPHG